MSVSIYYTARRSTPLTSAERTTVSQIVQRYDIGDRLQEYFKTGQGLNWESFSVYDPPTEPDLIFEGATKLPDNTEMALWEGVQHWSAALSEIRRVLHDAAWHVHVDDHDLVWNETQRMY